MQRYIFCLGNPGKKYESTRHNIGFLVADSIASVLDQQFLYDSRANCQFLEHNEITLVKPLSYMNRSGACVHYFVKHKIVKDLSEIVVVTDNFDLDAGILRYRTRGSRNPKHNGIRSISTALQSNEYARLYCGVGSPPHKSAIVDYVLSSWQQEETEFYQSMCASSVKTVLTYMHRPLSDLNNFIASHNQDIVNKQKLKLEE